jgi:hypothetical protein
MIVKKFFEWSQYDSSENSFTESYEIVLNKYEERMQKEGIDFGGYNYLFVTDLQDLRVYEKFEDDLSNAASEWYDKTYHSGYDPEYGEPLVNDEYRRVEKEAKEASASISGTQPSKYHRQKAAIRGALLSNLIEKHWEEWKNIYKKWIKYVHDHRGTLHGRHYGI